MENYFNQLGWFIGFGSWPTAFTIILVVSSIVNKIKLNKNIQTSIVSSNYNDMYNNLFPRMINGYIGIWMIILIISTAPFLNLFNMKFLLYINAMMNKIEVLSTICIGLMSLVITLAVFVTVFDKNYYIVFSIKDILSRYRFLFFLILDIISCIVTCLITCTLLDGQLMTIFELIRFMALEYAFSISIFCTSYLLIILIKIIFSEKKDELKLLKHLHERFWKREIDTSNMKKNWKKQNTRINIEYLANKFLLFSKRKEIKEIQEIEYVYIKNKYKEEYIQWAKRTNIKIICILFLISLIICLFQEDKIKIFFIITNLICTIGITVLCLIRCKFLDDTIFMLYCANSGYDIIKDNKRHNSLIIAVPLRKRNIYDKYFDSMNSLVGFFFIWLFDVKIKDEADKTEIKKQFINLVNYFENRRCSDLVEYFPLLTIGYLCFYNGIIIEEIKEVYKKIIENSTDLHKCKFLFQKMIYSQSSYIASDSRIDKEAFEERTIEYFMWLDEKT